MSDWIIKAEREEPLNETEAQALEEALQAPESQTVAQMVGSLPPFDAPTTISKRVASAISMRGRLRYAYGFGAAAAACLAVFAVLSQEGPEQAPVTQSEASELLEWHYEAAATTVLPGDGANLAGFSQVATQEARPQ